MRKSLLSSGGLHASEAHCASEAFFILDFLSNLSGAGNQRTVRLTAALPPQGETHL